MTTKRITVTLATCIAALATFGCAAPTIADDKPVWPPPRFIVKPKSPLASEAEIVALVRSHLRQPERVRLFRPMSGGAYVFEVVPHGTRDDVAAIVSALNATGAFAYVEIDAPVTIR